jgi:hypothetical protein
VDRSLGAQRLEVGAAVPNAPRGELLEEQGGRRFLPAAGVNLENLKPRRSVGQRKREFSVESPGSSKRSVDGVHPVRRAQHNDPPARVQTVHEREQRRDDGVMDLVTLRRANGREAVDLVEEYNRRLPLLRLFKQ